MLKNLSYPKQIFYFILIVLFSWSLFAILPMLLVPLLFNISFSGQFSILNNLDNIKEINILKLHQLFNSTGLFIVPPLLFSIFYGKKEDFLKLTKKSITLKKNDFFQILVLTILLMIVAFPFINLLAELNSKLVLPDFLSSLQEWMKAKEEQARKVTEAFLNVKSITGLFVNIFVIAIIPAIGEEFMFRGIIQQILHKWTGKVHFSIFLSAILFSALHLQFFGFFPRMLLGAMFGYIFFWTKTLWIPILAHFVNNGGAVILSYYIKQKGLNPDLENYGANNESYLAGIISFILMIIILLYIKKRTE